MDIELIIDEVLKFFKMLNVNKVIGLDGIFVCLLCEMVDNIVFLFIKFFNKFF